MKSNICKINKGDLNLQPLLQETEKVAEYNALSDKNALLLRLLAEELVSMLPSIVSKFDGEFWIANDGNYYELCVNVFVEDMNAVTRERLINVSKDNRNAFSVGVSGKIRALFDHMAMVSDPVINSPAGKYGMATNIDFSQLWSMKEYCDSVKEESSEAKEAWDEFERSILVKIADDVVVGVKGQKVKIIIKKTFA